MRAATVLNERRNIKQKGPFVGIHTKRKTLNSCFVAKSEVISNLDRSPNVGEFSLNLANSPLSREVGVHRKEKKFSSEGTS